jgi:beta-N-acetylhexosaminidase
MSNRRVLVRLLLGVVAAAASALALTVPPSGASERHAALTARQLAGQRVIFSYPGLVPPASLLDHIRAGEAAGVIFFRENISSPAQIAGVIQQLRAAQQQSPVGAPLLLMTDQEGGLVRRLPGAPELSAKQVGQAADPPAAATQAGTAAGQNLRGVGMNVNLAPVLDVFYTAGNFIDRFQRSFSHDPQVVAELGADFIAAQQQQGVAATAKHFPGLGSAPDGQNTDLTPVTVPLSRADLRGTDETPYPKAIQAGVRLIMLSWAVYPALDGAHPAGLSGRVIQGELRGRLHYRGVTITDGLEAGALTAYGTPAQRATLAAQAGMDLILCAARDVTQGEDALSGLAGAVADGQLDSRAFQASVDRIAALRASLPQ